MRNNLRQEILVMLKEAYVTGLQADDIATTLGLPIRRIWWMLNGLRNDGAVMYLKGRWVIDPNCEEIRP
jgi:hypothetical protein